MSHFVQNEIASASSLHMIQCGILLLHPCMFISEGKTTQ